MATNHRTRKVFTFNIIMVKAGEVERFPLTYNGYTCSKSTAKALLKEDLEYFTGHGWQIKSVSEPVVIA